ncbi:hypothetical protein J3F83DRAFT_743142 [Trichoderma novae-zelandiae]
MDLALSQLYRCTRRLARARKSHVVLAGPTATTTDRMQGWLGRDALCMPRRQFCAETTRLEGLEKHKLVSCRLDTGQFPPSTMSWSALGCPRQHLTFAALPSWDTQHQTWGHKGAHKAQGGVYREGGERESREERRQSRGRQKSQGLPAMRRRWSSSFRTV